MEDDLSERSFYRVSESDVLYRYRGWDGEMNVEEGLPLDVLCNLWPGKGKTGHLLGNAWLNEVRKLTLSNSVRRIRQIEGLQNLIEIDLGEGLGEIGFDSFKGCLQLKSVTIPGSVCTLAGKAFPDVEEITFFGRPNVCEYSHSGRALNNNKLQKINLHLGSLYLFQSCPLRCIDGRFCDEGGRGQQGAEGFLLSWLQKTFSKSNPAMEMTINGQPVKACSGETTFLLSDPDSVQKLSSSLDDICQQLLQEKSERGELQVPECERIEAGAYAGYDMNKVIIPEGVKSIGAWAFWKCSNLEEVVIPDSVEYISTAAFEGCTQLRNITIPSHVKSIGIRAFAGCSSLTELTIPSNVTVIGESAFNNCGNLTKISLSDKMISVEPGLFCGCSKLTEVKIPYGVTKIGEGAFSGCSSLTQMIIPSSVTSIGARAFFGCSRLAQITIPSGVPSIGAGTFFECSSLTEVEIPLSVESIGQEAFSGCSKLQAVTVPWGGSGEVRQGSVGVITMPPRGLQVIGNKAFARCVGLTRMTILAGVGGVGKDAFFGCVMLEKILVQKDKQPQKVWDNIWATLRQNGYIGGDSNEMVDGVECLVFTREQQQ